MRLTRRSLIAALLLAGCAAGPRPPELLRIDASDGVVLGARLYGSGPRAVVLVPGGHGVAETWDLQARRLARDGFRVLAIDYRGRGASPGRPDDEKTHLDVIGAARRLRADGALSVGVVGASWGGWAAATAAIAEPGLIDRLVLLAHSPVERPEALGGEKLFIVARDDRDGSGRARLETIREQYERAPRPKRLVLLDGAAHAQFLFLTGEGERLYGEMLRFLSGG